MRRCCPASADRTSRQQPSSGFWRPASVQYTDAGRQNPKGNVMTPSGTPAATVIVPAYDEEAAIADCLASLLAQTVSDLEVIVVDDSSRDRTASVARACGARVLTVPHGGPAAAK